MISIWHAILIVFIFLICICALIIALAIFIYIAQRMVQIKVPTLQTNVEDLKMLIHQLNLKKSDKIIDLGSGTGSVMFEFEKYSPAAVIGYELSIVPFLISLMRRINLKSKVRIVRKNFLKADFSKESIAYAYLSSDMMSKLGPLIEENVSKDIITTFISCDFPLPKSNCTLKTIRGAVHTFYLYKKST